MIVVFHYGCRLCVEKREQAVTSAMSYNLYSVYGDDDKDSAMWLDNVLILWLEP